LMLISLPAERPHSFDTHLQAPLMHRTTQSSTFVETCDSSALQQMQYLANAPCPLVPLHDCILARLVSNLGVFELSDQLGVSLPRLLRRLKLGISPAGVPTRSLSPRITLESG